MRHRMLQLANLTNASSKRPVQAEGRPLLSGAQWLLLMDADERRFGSPFKAIQTDLD